MGLDSAKITENFSPYGNFKPKLKMLITFERKEIVKKCQRTTYTKVGEESYGDIISGLPRP
jgi:hypothetical protein